MENSRADLLVRLGHALDVLGGPAVNEPALRREIMVNAGQMLTSVIETLRAGWVDVDGPALRFSARPAARVTRGAHARESLLAEATFADILIGELADCVDGREDAENVLALAVRALNQTAAVGVEAAFMSYSGFLLDEVRKAQAAERARIARELHDRTGFWLNAAYRQLELLDIDAADAKLSEKASTQLRTAWQAVRESMRSLRAIMSEQRLREPMKCLGNALRVACNAFACTGVTFRVEVSGDEAWAPYPVKDEAFLIVREAVHNAVRHGRPERVAVDVHIAPHELRAYVDDDGCGFDPAEVGSSDGMGLPGMRERTELIGGTLTVHTTRGRGTRVELVVPLTDQSDE